MLARYDWMMPRLKKPMAATAVLLWGAVAFAGVAAADERSDGWLRQSDPDGSGIVRTKDLPLHPRSEPVPALRYRFLPDSFQARPGNAALYYLKAMGFLEQQYARERINEVYDRARQQASEADTSTDQLPPLVWLDTPPDQLPVQEVKEFLRLTAFQKPMLREAAARSDFDMQRNLREVDDLIGYLLPEIQSMRQLARYNSLRCRLALAEDRVEDAIEICGQQFAMGHHLGQDDFLVSNLVGMAIVAIGWNDLLYVVQHPDCPNLYWALATLPDPLVSTAHAMDVEHNLLYLQVPALQDVSEAPQPAEHWSQVIDRLAAEPNSMYAELDTGVGESDFETRRAWLVAAIAASYPAARDYLIETVDLPRQQVEAYPTAQTVLLATVRFYERWRDEYFKWQHLSFAQRQSSQAASSAGERLAEAADRAGWFAMPTKQLIPLLGTMTIPEIRCRQQIAMLQTVEAIRDYAAANQGQLPDSLDQLSLPAPPDPRTGKPFDYQRQDDAAVLSGQSEAGLQTRLQLRIQPSDP